MNKAGKGFSILVVFIMVMTLLSASALAVEIQAGTGTITPNIGLSTGTVIGFAGQEWWVIGYNGSGVYTSGTGPATLFLKSTGNPYGTVYLTSLVPVAIT